MGDLPAGIDQRLWFKIASCPGRHYLEGSCYTHVGRMASFCDLEKIGLCVSKSEMVESSPETDVWVDGFLSGNAPDAAWLFGEEAHEFDDDDPRELRWRDHCEAFRRTGSWPWAPWRPLPDLPELSGPAAWTVLGDEEWIWSDGTWRVNGLAGSWPTLREGTICHERRHHDLTMVDDAITICDDCGHVF